MLLKACLLLNISFQGLGLKIDKFILVGVQYLGNLLNSNLKIDMNHEDCDSEGCFIFS